LNLVPNQKSNLTNKRSQIFHIAHANTYFTDGDSGSLSHFINNNQNISMDLSFLSFNEINPIISSDRSLIKSMLDMDSIDISHKMISSATEFEGDSFVSLRNLNKKSYHDCVLWSNALELALDIKDKFQVCFSLNFPIYSNVIDIPEIATWLVSNNSRQNFMKGMNEQFLKNSKLLINDKILDFSEFVCITRGSPAKVLGLGSIKGNLGKGADADINILDLDISKIDISKDSEKLKKTLSNINCVIKGGEIIKKQEKIDLGHHGLIFWSQGESKAENKDFIMSKKKEFFQKYSSVFYDSYKTSINKELLREIK